MAIQVIAMLDNVTLITDQTTDEINTRDARFGPAAVRDSLYFFIDVTAVSGTNPTLDGELLFCTDKGDFKIDDLPQRTVVGQISFRCPVAPDCIKIKTVLGGTSPSFTFSIYLARI